MTLTFTPSSITQTPQDDPQQGDFPAGEKTRIGKGKHRINDIKFSPDGTRLAVAGDFGILLYDVQMSGKNVQKGNIPVKFTGHLGRAGSVAFSQDGIMISSASSGKTIRIRLWDVDTGQLLRTFTEHTTLSAWGIAFSPDGKTIAIKDLEKNIYLLDADTGKHLRTLTGHTSLIWWIVFSPDSRTIATASYDKTIRLWDVNTGQLLRTPIGHTEQIRSVSFSPDRRTIATGSHDHWRCSVRMAGLSQLAVTMKLICGIRTRDNSSEDSKYPINGIYPIFQSIGAVSNCPIGVNLRKITR